MPYKTKKSYSKPRPYRRKKAKKSSYARRYRRRRLTMTGIPSGMPVQRIAKLRYVETASVSSTLGVLSAYVFYASSIFDPNYTTTGHQPMGRDQWATLFNHYVVLGSKISVKFIPDNTTTSPMAVGVYLHDDFTVPYTNSNDYIEARRGSYRLQAPGQNEQLNRPVTSYYSAKKFFNVKDVKDNIDRLGAPMAANPAENGFFHVWAQTLDNSTDSVRFCATIDYIVLFSEPKSIPIS